MALVIRDNVEHHRLPKTRDIRLLDSHIRVTTNRRYIRMIEDRIAEIKAEKIGVIGSDCN